MKTMQSTLLEGGTMWEPGWRQRQVIFNANLHIFLVDYNLFFFLPHVGSCILHPCNSKESECHMISLQSNENIFFIFCYVG
jgi:hypothetical protein